MKKIEKVIILVLIVICILFISYYLDKSNKIQKDLSSSYKSEYINKNDKDKDKDKEVVKQDTITIKKQVPISYSAAIPIFMYHWIREDTGDYIYPENMVKPSSLEEQIKYLVDNEFECIYISDINNIYEYKKPIALTFDDGWLDVYTKMFPLAKKYNVKFSMYVITGEIGNNGYCNREQLLEMKNSGLVDIQSHTVTHPYLSELNYEEQKNELFNSKKYLKDELSINSDVICYPYGSRNENTVTLSEEAGYKYGLDMDGGVYYTNIHTNIYMIPRIYVNRSMDINLFSDYANTSDVQVEWE